MNKYCMVLELKENKVENYIEEHKKIHLGIYKELLNVIKKSGVKKEVIFIHNNLAIIYFEANDLDKSYKFQEKFDIAQKWNKAMQPLFTEKSIEKYKVNKSLLILEKVFDLEQQLEGKLNNY